APGLPGALSRRLHLPLRPAELEAAEAGGVEQGGVSADRPHPPRVAGKGSVRRHRSPAAVSVAMSSSDNARVAARAKLSTWARRVALAMGAVTPGRAISQARAISAGAAPWRSETSSSAARIRIPRSFR